MRIQTQAETYALRMAASEFPWQGVPHSEDYPDHTRFEARLENGHRLSAHQPLWTGDSHWMSAIDTGNYNEDRPFDHWHPAGPFNSPQEAQADAEARYRKMFPIGTNTGPHDSGIDYSDLNKFKDF